MSINDLPAVFSSEKFYFYYSMLKDQRLFNINRIKQSDRLQLIKIIENVKTYKTDSYEGALEKRFSLPTNIRFRIVMFDLREQKYNQLRSPDEMDYSSLNLLTYSELIKFMPVLITSLKNT